MCQIPTHAFVKQNGVVDLISEPFSPHQQRVQTASAARKALLSCTIVGSEERENKQLFEPLIESIYELDHRQPDLTQWQPMIEPFLP